MRVCMRIHWLHRGCDRALRAHVLLGDALGLWEQGVLRWFLPGDVPKIGQSARAAMLRYESRGESIGFCVPLAAQEIGAKLLQARAAADPAAAARKWGPLLGKFTYLRQGADETLVETPLWSAPFIRARRRAHADPQIDGFLLRDRTWAVGAFERSLRAGYDAEDESRTDARGV